jgi:hypothetical protein
MKAGVHGITSAFANDSLTGTRSGLVEKLILPPSCAKRKNTLNHF